MFLGQRRLPVVCQSGAVEQQHGMGVPGDVKRDLVDVHLHRLGIGEGQRQRRAHASGRADRTEEIGALVALIGGLTRSGSSPGPLSDEPILLADAGLVLEPDLDLLLARHALEVSRERAAEVFLKASMVAPSCIGCRGRALM